MSQKIIHVGQAGRQVVVQKNNLISVCRMAVKTLIDKSSYQVLEPECEELVNFCAILEHLLNFRIKNDSRWFSRQEPFCFWNYIQTACAGVTHNCLRSIENLEKVSTSRGKGRAWIRMVLMEKRLAEYLTVALQQRKLTRSCYHDGAVLLSEEIPEICGVLMGLSAIDFSFDLRTQDLDYKNPPVIDFTPYLKFEQSPKSLSLDMMEDSDMPSLMTASASSEVFDDEEHCEHLKVKFVELDRQYRTISEQKGYLEELLRLRESQLSEMQRQQKKVMDTLSHYQEESKKERQQLESVIIELQAQINSMKSAHEAENQHLRIQLRRITTKPPTVRQPDILMQDMMSIPRTPRPPLPGKAYLNSPEIVVKYASSHSRPIQFDTRSVLSDSSNVSITKEETQSLVPLAGSFTSEKSNDPAPTLDQFGTNHLAPIQVHVPKPLSVILAGKGPDFSKIMNNSTTQDSAVVEDTSKPDLVVDCDDSDSDKSIPESPKKQENLITEVPSEDTTQLNENEQITKELPTVPPNAV